MGKRVMAALRTRAEIIGKDEEFSVNVKGFDATFTDVLSDVANLNWLVELTEEDDGNFTFHGKDETSVKLHRSWVKNFWNPLTTVDEAIEALKKVEEESARAALAKTQAEQPTPVAQG